MPTTTPSTLTINEYHALVTGIPTYCPNATFTLAGQTFTAPQAVTFVQTILTGLVATATAKTEWVNARAAEERLVAQDGATVEALRANLALMFSNNATALAAFLITPKKARQPLSAEARLAATAKMRATRIARGTTSKKKKATISGNVTGVTITPVTTPSSTPTAAVPAAASTTTSTTAGATTPVATSPASATSNGSGSTSAATNHA